MSVPGTELRNNEFVAHAVNRIDDLHIGELLGDLFPQVLDVGVDGAVVAFEVVTLDEIQELIPGEDPGGVGHQDLQQAEFTGSQLQLRPSIVTWCVFASRMNGPALIFSPEGSA